MCLRKCQSVCRGQRCRIPWRWSYRWLWVSDVGVGSQAWIFWKTGECFYLRGRLSSTIAAFPKAPITWKWVLRYLWYNKNIFFISVLKNQREYDKLNIEVRLIIGELWRLICRGLLNNLVILCFMKSPTINSHIFNSSVLKTHNISQALLTWNSLF